MLEATWKEVAYRSELGKAIAQRCKHPKIPGLDASGCPSCKVWWVDQEMRELLVPSRRKK